MAKAHLTIDDMDNKQHIFKISAVFKIQISILDKS